MIFKIFCTSPHRIDKISFSPSPSRSNDTPTFNSNHSIVQKFSFLDDKENIPIENLPSPVPPAIPCKQSAPNIISRGSTSPESNELNKNNCNNSEGKKHREKKIDRKRESENKEELEKNEKEDKGCNCKKSQCKKLYCECFLSQKCCTSACSCFSCCNTHENEELIQEIRKAIIQRNPHAFQEKFTLINKDKNVSNDFVIPIHSRGCKCRKSKCQTGYCECHQLGAKCTSLCKCEGCENYPDCISFK